MIINTINNYNIINIINNNYHKKNIEKDRKKLDSNLDTNQKIYHLSINITDRNSIRNLDPFFGENPKERKNKSEMEVGPRSTVITQVPSLIGCKGIILHWSSHRLPVNEIEIILREKGRRGVS